MTVPKKNARKIDVEGKTYHWFVKRQHDPEPDDFNFPILRLTVSDGDRKFLKQVDFQDRDAVSPADVANFIQTQILG